LPKRDKTKTPKQKIELSVEKRPRSVAVDTMRVGLRWSFVHFDPHDWSDPKAQVGDISFIKVADKLKSYELRTWGDIQSNPKRDHPIDVAHLLPEAQKRLDKIDKGDWDPLWSLRFNARPRIWGKRDENGVFLVLWWDPHHRICPSPKKNT